ncbi:hypothetical protein BJ322DRAFT_888592 [Thelephora terrestris]|uniref:Secreted protein n=1 Tax=Thelephora terrestris TaxID=56493 RepID=A0A9P6HF58_9AGAM|nr:hypothetical protein BJ322DRAFT_888592 [Thelephora terrestris]
MQPWFASAWLLRCMAPFCNVWSLVQGIPRNSIRPVVVDNQVKLNLSDECVLVAGLVVYNRRSSSITTSHDSKPRIVFLTISLTNGKKTQGQTCLRLVCSQSDRSPTHVLSRLSFVASRHVI